MEGNQQGSLEMGGALEKRGPRCGDGRGDRRGKSQRFRGCLGS